MRHVHTQLLLVLVFATSAVMSGFEKPIAPQEAKSHAGKMITVELTVKASKKSAKRKLVFLDSMENHRDPDNLGITLTETAESELARMHNTSDIAFFLRHKTIRVTGTVTRRGDHTYIDLDNADGLKLLETK